MKSESRNNFPFASLIAAVLFLAVVLGCGNPLGRFSKQYKCQVDGKAEPRTAYEYVERGSEHMRADQVDCALAACAEAVRLAPSQPQGYACRGTIYASKGEYLKGLNDLNYAIKLQPQNGDYYHSRAQIHGSMENMDQAIADATKATELIDSEFGRSVAFAFRGSIHKKQSKLVEAIKDYDEAVKLAPDFAYHFGNRGDVYYELKDYNKAIADYDQAIRLDPRNQYFLRDRAEAFRAIGKSDLATQDDAAADAIASGAADTTASPAPSASSGAKNDVVQNPIAGGELKGKAISLPKPAYPPVARSVRAWGLVVVQVTVNAEGNVTSANATVGHALLRPAAVAAARESKFQNFTSGEMRGTISYDFKLQ